MSQVLVLCFISTEGDYPACRLHFVDSGSVENRAEFAQLVYMAELRYQGDKKCSLQAKWPLYGTGTFL